MKHTVKKSELICMLKLLLAGVRSQKGSRVSAGKVFDLAIDCSARAQRIVKIVHLDA